MPKFTHTLQFKARRMWRRAKARQRLNAMAARGKHKEQFWSKWDEDKLVWK